MPAGTYQESKSCSACLKWSQYLLQAQVSSVIRCDTDCVGVAALLPLKVFRDSPAVQQILSYWQNRVGTSEDVQQQLATAIKSNKTSILISERVLNAPPELAAPLIAGLLQELKDNAADEDPAQQVHGTFSTMLHCATAYVDSGAAANDLGAVPVSQASKQSVRMHPGTHVTSQ
jgi:hypothetical protein